MCEAAQRRPARSAAEIASSRTPGAREGDRDPAPSTPSSGARRGPASRSLASSAPPEARPPPRGPARRRAEAAALGAASAAAPLSRRRSGGAAPRARRPAAARAPRRRSRRRGHAGQHPPIQLPSERLHRGLDAPTRPRRLHSATVVCPVRSSLIKRAIPSSSRSLRRPIYAPARLVNSAAMDRYDPQEIERRWQEVWERERTWEVPNPGQPGFDEAKPKSYVLEMLPYPSGEPHVGHLKVYSVGDAVAHYAPAQRLPGHPPDGLRRVRPARREPRDQDRRAPARLHGRGDRRVPAPVPPLGDLDRLEPRARHPRALLLPLDPVDLSEAARARPRLSQGGGGQVVPEGRHRAGQRAGRRRALRALRHPGRGPPARAVVPSDHRLRRPAARRSRRDRLARARQDHAAQLDRSLRGRRGDLPLRGAGNRLPGVHDPPGHPVRGDLLRRRARASRRASARRRDGRGGSGCAST